MTNREKQSNELLKKIAAKHGVSVGDVVREMQDIIDATWDNPDPAAKKKQRELFPNGKPSIEEFIRAVTKHIKQ